MSDFIDDGNHPSNGIAHAVFTSLKGKRFPLDPEGNHLILGDSGNPHTLAQAKDRLLVGTLYGSDDGVIGKSILVYFDGTFQQAYGWLHDNHGRAAAMLHDALSYGLNPYGYVLDACPALPLHKPMYYANILTAKQFEGMKPAVLENAIFSYHGTLCVVKATDADFDWRSLFRNPKPVSEFFNFRETPLAAVMPFSETRHRMVSFSREYANREDMPPPTCSEDPTGRSNSGSYDGGVLGIRDMQGLLVNCWEAVDQRDAHYRYGRIGGVKYLAVDLRNDALHYHPEHWFEADRERVQQLFDNPIHWMHYNALLMTPGNEYRRKLETDLHWEHTSQAVGTDAYAEALYRDCSLVVERGISLRRLPKKITLEMMSLPDVNEKPARPPEVEAPALKVDDGVSTYVPAEGEGGWPGFYGLWKRLFGR